MHPSRQLGSLLLIASVLLVLAATKARRTRLTHLHAAQPSATDPLTAIYANIRRQADEAAEHFPRAHNMVAKCVRDASGRLSPPEFSDGHGPIGTYAMLQSPDNLEVLRWCRSAFVDRFIAEIIQTLTSDS